MELGNNTILITGGSSGIGLSLCSKLLKLNNEIIIIGRDINKLNAAKKELPDTIIYQCDLSKKEEIIKLYNWISINHNNLNILINNAGIQLNYYFTDTAVNIEDIENEIDINLTAPIYLTRLMIPILKDKKSAAIINVSSGLGFVPKEQSPVYCGTKAAIHIFTKALRYQLEKTNIKVFEIIPPLVDTPMTNGRGRGKIHPDKLVDEFIELFKKNIYEMNIGKIKLLRCIQRIYPKLADRILRKGV